MQPYLRYIYGDVFGFLAAWTWIVAVMPATLAILSIVFVESLYSAAGVTDQAGRVEHKLLSVLVLAVVGVANSISTRATTRLNGVFVGTKFFAIVAVVVAGLAVVALQVARPGREDVGGRDWFTTPWFRYRDSANPDGSTTRWRELSSWDVFGHYSAALYGALWAYSGWDKVRTPRLPCPRAGEEGECATAGTHAGHLHHRRALRACSPAPAGHQHRYAHHRAVVPGRQLGLLHPAPVGRGVDDRQHRRGKPTPTPPP